MTPGTVLLVAATELELCGHPGLACGIGPVEAAAGTARALALEPPSAVLHVGVAGGCGLEPGTLVVGTESDYVDIAAAIPIVSEVVPDARLLAAVRAAFPGAPALPIGTSAAVSALPEEKREPGTFGARHLGEREPGTFGARHRGERVGLRVEAMEGFAVLRACELAGVPAIEVRVVSNEIGEPDRARWEIPRALDALASALPGLLAAVRE